MKPFRYSLAAAILLLIVPGVAHAGSVSATNSSATTIVDNAVGNPYPSTLKVEGGDGTIASGVKPFVLGSRMASRTTSTSRSSRRPARRAS